MSTFEERDFEARKRAMLARLTARQKPTKTSSSAASTPSAEDEAEELLKQAEKALAEAVFPDPAIITRIESVSGTLPPGRLSARLTKTLKQLRERFTKESQASKPSFSFSRKPPATSKAPVSSQAIAEAAEAAEKAPNVPSPNSFSVSKKDGTRQEFAADDGTDIFVTDVAKSYLTFGFRASTVHLSGVTNSTLIFLPVRTSILIRNCSGLTLVAAAQQIRIHDSTDLKLHVAIRGAVIIERCSEVSVAPYKMVEGLVEKSELPVEDKWDEVQDFNWLVTTRPSPNWKKMAEDEWSEFGLNAPQ